MRLVPDPAELEARGFWERFAGPGECLLRLAVGVHVIRSYRNWSYPLLDQIGVLDAEYDLALRNGMVFRCRPRIGDWHVVNQMWFSCPYFYQGHAIDAHSVVVDIGAHIGAFAIRAATLTPDVRVYAYEPSPANYRHLERNIELNGLAGRIVTRQSAVCGTGGRRRLYHDSIGAARHSLFPPSSGRRGFTEVDCVTLTDILDENGIDRCEFLKIDCEGAEYEILLQSPDQCFERVRKMSVEYHSMAGSDVVTLRARLESLGFRVAVINRPHILFATNSRTG